MFLTPDELKTLESEINAKTKQDGVGEIKLVRVHCDVGDLITDSFDSEQRALVLGEMKKAIQQIKNGTAERIE